MGLSGGVDSSLSAALAARALGPERVHGFLLPYRTSSPESERDARAVAGHLGIPHRAIDISPMVDAYFDAWSRTRRPTGAATRWPASG